MTVRITRRQSHTWFIALAGASILAGCTPQIEHRGYYAKPGTFDKVAEGMPKTEVEGLLGSPSTTASVNFQGDSYYYISSVTESRSFFTPREISREVIAVRFNREDQVSSVAQYGLQDGRIININTRETPVAGADYSILLELFNTMTRASPGTNMLGRKL